MSLRAATLIAALLVLAAAPAAHADTRTIAVGQSFENAYRAANAGDVLEIAPGVHGGTQTIPEGTKSVTFRGLPGNKVRKIDVFASNVLFEGVDVDAGGMTHTAFYVGGGSNVTFRNGRIGNVVDEKGSMLGGWGSTDSQHVVFDNVEFHDVLQIGDGVHNECLYSASPGLTVRNSTFRNCATMDLMVTRGFWWGQPTYGGVTLENNVFAHSTNGQDPRWHAFGFLVHGEMGQLTNARIVNNTFETRTGGVTNAEIDSASGVWANNIGGGWDCLPGMTYAGNVGKKCGASDVAANPASSCGPPACPSSSTAAVGWTNPAQFDFTLTAGSPAIGAASAQYAPERDRRGYRRDGNPDAGALEHGAGPDGGDPSSGSPGSTPGAGWRLRSAGLRPRVICRIARPGCPSSTKLRLRLGRPAKVTVRLQRLRKGARPKLQRSVRLRGIRLHKARRIRAAGLPTGRYRVLVRATDATGKRSALVRLRLRVR